MASISEINGMLSITSGDNVYHVPRERLFSIAVATQTTAQVRLAMRQYNSRSRLLSLPAEVRSIIYEMVLGGEVIHIFAYGLDIHLPRYEMFLCNAASNEESLGMSLRHAHDSNRIDHYYGRHDNCDEIASRRQPDLSLLSVCSRIHSEAALVPFASNEFLLDGFELPIILPIMLRPQQLNAITRLQLYIDMSYKACPYGMPHRNVFGQFMVSAFAAPASKLQRLVIVMEFDIRDDDDRLERLRNCALGIVKGGRRQQPQEVRIFPYVRDWLEAFRLRNESMEQICELVEQTLITPV